MAHEFIELGLIVLFAGEAKIGQRNRIEIVVGQRDEAKTYAPQIR